MGRRFVDCGYFGLCVVILVGFGCVVGDYGSFWAGVWVVWLVRGYFAWLVRLCNISIKVVYFWVMGRSLGFFVCVVILRGYSYFRLGWVYYLLLLLLKFKIYIYSIDRLYKK